MRENRISRRTAMKVTGAAAATALVAGCTGDDNGDDDDGDNGGNGGVEIDAGADIRLDGQTAGWELLEPTTADDNNPTLVLEDGADYTIGWTEGDGAAHNIELWNADGEVVDDLQTEEVQDPDEDQILEFTASDEITNYVCDPHDNTMNGEIQVQ